MKHKPLLLLGAILITIGVLRPNLGNIFDNSVVCPVVTGQTYVLDPPADVTMLTKAKKVRDILLESVDSTTTSDCLKLSSLYNDLSVLIAIDDDDTVITDTATIREANSLAGKMLNLNIKNKYPNLAQASRDVVITAIGDDDIILDQNTRTKAVEAFRALSWAFYEGSK